MLPRFRRVSKSLFPTILKFGQVWQTPFLSLRVWSDQTKPSLAKFSVVASSKVSNKAVERNLWKRRTRAILTKLSPQIKDNYYCLLFFKKGITALSYRQLSQIVRQLFIKANLLIEQ
ncbi:MAG: ribonuclease P protein component [Candidatus Vogelbacteria bacterium]|nr:ribonuclease P protein component [Candidatus Vogelbacteria bacterium]